MAIYYHSDKALTTLAVDRVALNQMYPSSLYTAGGTPASKVNAMREKKNGVTTAQVSPKSKVGSRYAEVRTVGKGTFGEVRLFRDIRSNGRQVAIKQVKDIFRTKVLTVRAVRELRFLRHFRGHRNVILTH